MYRSTYLEQNNIKLQMNSKPKIMPKAKFNPRNANNQQHPIKTPEKQVKKPPITALSNPAVNNLSPPLIKKIKTKSQQTSQQKGFYPDDKSNTDSIESGIEKEEILSLENTHLKRENNFLKMKIKEILKGQSNDKRTTLADANLPDSQSLQNTLNFLFEEIHNLLNSLSHLFKLTLNSQQLQKYAKNRPQKSTLDNQKNPIKKQIIFKKYIFNRKLEKIMLQSEEQKYPALLELFKEFYTHKEDSQKCILKSLDDKIRRVNELNGWLLEKAHHKGSSDQGSIKKVRTTTQKNPEKQLLKVPSGNRLTFSPIPKDNRIIKHKREVSP